MNIIKSLIFTCKSIITNTFLLQNVNMHPNCSHEKFKHFLLQKSKVITEINSVVSKVDLQVSRDNKLVEFMTNGMNSKFIIEDDIVYEV